MDILLNKNIQGQQTDEFAAFFVAKKISYLLILGCQQVLFLLISR